MHALNPVQRIGDQIAEPILLHEPKTSKAEAATPGRRAARAGRAPRRRAHDLPAPALRRPEAARHDRDGARLPTRGSSSPTSRPPRSTSWCRRRCSTVLAEPRHGPRRRHDLHQPRPVGALERVRPDRGDVRRADRRGGPGRRGVRPPAAPVRRGARRRLPAHRRHAVPLRARRAARRPAVPRRPARAAARSTRAARAPSTAAPTDRAGAAPGSATADARACCCTCPEVPRHRASTTVPTPSARALEARDVGGRVPRPRRRRHRVGRRRRRPRAGPRRDRRARRRERLRQDHARAHAARPREARRRARCSSTASRWPTTAKALKAYRRRVQLVLQDPTGALNPRHTVYEAVAEGLRIHGLGRGRGAARRARRSRWPGCARRSGSSCATRTSSPAASASAWSSPARWCSSPTSSSPTSRSPASTPRCAARSSRCCCALRDELGLSLLVVTHDLGLAWNIADRVAVMYLGRIVEKGPTEELLSDPQHPYTQALLSVVPEMERLEQVVLTGEPPDPTKVPAGCRFHPRCPVVASGEAARLGIEDALPHPGAAGAPRERRAHDRLPPRPRPSAAGSYRLADPAAGCCRSARSGRILTDSRVNTGRRSLGGLSSTTSSSSAAGTTAWSPRPTSRARGCARWCSSAATSWAARPSASSRSAPTSPLTSLSLRRLLAAADAGARPRPRAPRLPRLPAGPVLRAAHRRPLPAAARRHGARGTSRSRSSPRRTPTPSSAGTSGWTAWARSSAR